jgi:hypothetical protein
MYIYCFLLLFIYVTFIVNILEFPCIVNTFDILSIFHVHTCIYLLTLEDRKWNNNNSIIKALGVN